MWLAADLPYLNMYAVGYPASLFARWAKKEMDLFERAKSSLETMSSYGIGNRPIVFVGHSLGGLLIKQMLRTARDSAEKPWQQIADQCRGVFFIATPHSGSGLANILSFLSLGLKSAFIDKLKADSSELTELNESFRAHCVKQPMIVVAYYEKFKTGKSMIVVDQKSADPGISGVTPIPVDADHNAICAPLSRQSPIYVSLIFRLKTIVPPPAAAPPDSFGDVDDMSSPSPLDRRDLHTKMIAAGREHEYLFANSSQSKFARLFEKTGLLKYPSQLHNDILLDIEQRFQNLVYHPLICTGASLEVVSTAIQEKVVEPLATKYGTSSATTTTIMNALYFLTERCHVRWDKP
ncbi:alpha/beta hydrolase [Xanthobacter tagetidis]|uniref:Alpha/beta hydrolase n=2 Tax=Xanthobacter tagetidis TaxID=60216 RepID=A0A3L7AME5_9HYPH|nr:ABC-three component system protein [Xanthobacter tagetidis]MBB6308881.1 pimeloyl-ACP methyl ester carboxylesterase [Xanthobacter tagetidis]RLP80602.1 alpha/beta hydrolase [Xanthobacter tagetidis]